MYQQYFNFASPPFSIAPNPRFVYLSPQHREALAHLLYGISAGGGFIALTGEVGTGKTTLCRCLMEQVPEDVEIALIFNPRLNARELLAGICDELHIPNPGEKASIKRLIDLLNHYLLDAHSRGRRTILVIDEAQNLTHDVLEQIRLLTNLETNETKLLQIILVGQPELRMLLARKNLRQLAQRITARYHLLPLSSRETEAYVKHRLEVSGSHRKIFSRPAMALIYRRSGGIPRLINLICDRALLGAYTLGKQTVGASIVAKAAREVLPESSGRPLRTAYAALVGVALLPLAVGLISKWERIHTTAPSSWGDVAKLFRQDQPTGQNPKAELTGTRDRHSDGGDSPALSSDAAGPGKPPNSLQLQQAPPGEASQNALNPPKAFEATAPPSDGKLPETAPSKTLAQDDFSKIIADPGLTRKLAFTQLYRLWGVAPPAGEYDECQFAMQNGLRCFSFSGDAGRLREIDRPGLLEFVLPDGSNRYAVLIGILGDNWVLRLGEHASKVEIRQVLPFWRGNFSLLWKPASTNAGILKLGKKSEDLPWIRRLVGAPASLGKESLFDAGVKERVMGFQRLHGLQADGEVGPMTMIMLEKAAARYDGPSLSEFHDQGQ